MYYFSKWSTIWIAIALADSFTLASLVMIVFTDKDRLLYFHIFGILCTEMLHKYKNLLYNYKNYITKI